MLRSAQPSQFSTYPIQNIDIPGLVELKNVFFVCLPFSLLTIIIQIEIFNGEENVLTLNQTYSKKFHCTYLLHYYPFDTQVLILS